MRPTVLIHILDGVAEVINNTGALVRIEDYDTMDYDDDGNIVPEIRENGFYYGNPPCAYNKASQKYERR